MIPSTPPPGFNPHRKPVRHFQAPGRVNLIGEHTDYNDGFVFPCAINRHTIATVATRADRKLRLWSSSIQGSQQFDLNGPLEPARDWTDYVVGVAVELAAASISIPGADILIDGDVPLSAGLSSSASIEVAAALALLSVAGTSLPPAQVALLCQRAENRFVGAPCGIMDQFASCHGKAGHAVLIDCRTLETRNVPLPHGFSLLVCNSMVKHSVGGGEYGERRAACEEASRILGVNALRDVSAASFAARSAELPETVRRRAKHVVMENDRVLHAVEVLQSGQHHLFGQMMFEAHASMRDDFEASCEEIDLLVDLAANTQGVLGARITGGGFGGCTVNLVQSEFAEQAAQQIASEYQRQTSIHPETYLFGAAGAAGEWKP